MAKKTVFMMAIMMVNLFVIFNDASAQQNLPPELIAYPDIILYNGKVLTADDNFTVVQALAIRDGKILKIGEATKF